MASRRQLWETGRGRHLEDLSIEPWMTADRRAHVRRRPCYSAGDIARLRLTRVFLHEDFLVCLLSDRRTLFVPLRISPVVAAAPLRTRYQWQVGEDGTSLLWTRGSVEERLRLPAMLAFPGSEISDAPGS